MVPFLSCVAGLVVGYCVGSWRAQGRKRFRVPVPGQQYNLEGVGRVVVAGCAYPDVFGRSEPCFDQGSVGFDLVLVQPSGQRLYTTVEVFAPQATLVDPPSTPASSNPTPPPTTRRKPPMGEA